MPINAKVKKTGELFEATNEETSSGGIYSLEEGKSYSGFLYTGHFDPTKATDDLTVFRCIRERTPANFSADELEQIPAIHKNSACLSEAQEEGLRRLACFP